MIQPRMRVIGGRAGRTGILASAALWGASAAVSGAASGMPADSPTRTLAAPVSGSDVTNFYKDPSPTRVVRFITYFDSLIGTGSLAAQPPVIGFLAGVFHEYPDRIDDMIPPQPSLPMLEIIAVALRLAGQEQHTLRVVHELVARGAAAPDLTQIPRSLDELPAAGPSEFDMLWGASFATGDPRFCARILRRFAAIANLPGNAEDMLAIAKGFRSRADLHWVTQKRGADKARELIGESSALWSLYANSRDHEFVRAVVSDYVVRHPTEPAAKDLIAMAGN